MNDNLCNNATYLIMTTFKCYNNYQSILISTNKKNIITNIEQEICINKKHCLLHFQYALFVQTCEKG